MILQVKRSSISAPQKRRLTDWDLAPYYGEEYGYTCMYRNMVWDNAGKAPSHYFTKPVGERELDELEGGAE